MGVGTNGPSWVSRVLYGFRENARNSDRGRTDEDGPLPSQWNPMFIVPVLRSFRFELLENASSTPKLRLRCSR